MKIALISMSGIRCCDPELLRLGLTLPGFVERSKVVAALPNLGLLTLAGMTPGQHAVKYFEVPDSRTFGPLPEGFDLAAISSCSAQISEAYELARRFREQGTAVVMGGLHATAVPQEALEHCHAVVVGEGESGWQAVLDDVELGALCGMYGTPGNGYDLRDAPTPSYHLLDRAKYNRLTIQTSRGCPHLCQFCGSSVLQTRKYKQKPVAKVLGELDLIRQLWEQPFVEFADDNSFVNRAYWRELLPELKRRHVRWFTETDVSVAEDEELLTMIRESGCVQVLIGLESPVEAGLRGLELHNDWKWKRWERYKEAVRRIQSHGITVNGCFVLGLDGHTPEVFDQVFEFVRDAGLYEVQITVLTPFPGTPLYERLQREGRMLEPGRWDKCTLFDINYRPTPMSVEELAHGFRSLGVKLYSEEFTAWRRKNFRRQWRARRQQGSRVS